MTRKVGAFEAVSNQPGIIGASVAVVAIVCATVALCLGHLTEAGYLGIVGAFGGVAIGAGAHAVGVKQGQP